MKKKFIIFTSKNWNIDTFRKNKSFLKGTWKILTKKSQLNFKSLKRYNPKFIFFPNLNINIDKKIIDNFNCICFHETDLPYGRGGSPIQNLILLKKNITKLTALKIENGIKVDEGKIYIKRKVKLNGTGLDIYKRCAKEILKMINIINSKKITPKKQVGKITSFKKRKPKDSKIPDTIYNISQIYDIIRMLDIPGYPKAFIKKKNFEVSFDNTNIKNDIVTAKATFKLI
jgi:methionyl-tRNA formyltransferase